jgi:hypothetical protein
VRRCFERNTNLLSDELFIDKTWTYDVHEDFPSEIRVGRDSKGNIKGKVFTQGVLAPACSSCTA